ncbi:sulfotransferase [Rhodobacteraceae bacterium 2376]|uniref:Sulfotransferase n=1 Tax=Rhabdonatronobacter sediminivivens TaxID=2743469 RepID=A0A7Z0I210_9RHOB|nr:tetratricopeptide repeat-containing sulfotransferase family protein [Rhabdonatronobacter sediminivivens]NYS26490.1 sulfotransferase [Rhabdonatronobacter sediminivivens]
MQHDNGTGRHDEAAEKAAPATEVLARIARHQAAGRLDQALELLDGLIAQHGPLPRLLHYKGITLGLRGAPEDAEALMREGLRKAPDDPLQHLDLGVLLVGQGRADEAEHLFRTATELAPNYGAAAANLGALLVQQGQYGEAIRQLDRALELDGSNVDVLTNLALAQLRREGRRAAVDVLYRALAADPLSARAHGLLAGALYRLERHDAAEHHARRALELAPESTEARLHLANALAARGALDEARALLLEAAGRPPAGLAALARLVQLGKVTPQGPERALVAQYLERADSLEDAAQATLHHAAAKVCDDLDDPDRAMEHWHAANAISARLHPHDADAFAARAARLRAFAAPALLARCSGAGVSDIAPIFICGLPRSGTTLMDQMFSGHPQVTAGGELRAMPQALHEATRLRAALEERLPEDQITADDFAQLGERYMDLVRAEGIRSEYVSDKMPSNYLYAGLIALALPRARLLVMRRHPLDCLLSNYTQHFGRNQPFSADFDHLARAWTVFDDMTRFWQEALPGRVRAVSYEAVVQDPEGQMRPVLDWLGLDWHPAMLEFAGASRPVVTASQAQVRAPLNAHAIGRWQRHARHLRPLAARLRAHLPPADLARCGLD